MVDDFLLVTTNLKTSNSFLQKMSQGDSHLGMKINSSKTSCNYETNIQHQGVKKHSVLKNLQYSGDGNTYFPWCGMLINTQTCSVKVDFSRFNIFQGKDDIASDNTCNEGVKLMSKMKHFVRPRCKPIFFDRRINPPDIIATNFYEILLFCALRTIRYINRFIYGSVNQNPDFICRCIHDVIVYAYNTIIAG